MNQYILTETFNAKFELVLLERNPRCLHFVLYNMRLVNTLNIAMYGAMNYSFLPNLVAFDAKLNEIHENKKILNFILHWKFRSVCVQNSSGLHAGIIQHQKPLYFMK